MHGGRGRPPGASSWHAFAGEKKSVLFWIAAAWECDARGNLGLELGFFFQVHTVYMYRTSGSVCAE